MSAPSAASPAGSVERPRGRSHWRAGPVRRLADGAFAMALTEWRKLRHNQLDLVTRSVQPLLWLFVFGTGDEPAALDPDRRDRVPRLPGAGRDGAGGDVRGDLLRARP